MSFHTCPLMPFGLSVYLRALVLPWQLQQSRVLWVKSMVLEHWDKWLTFTPHFLVVRFSASHSLLAWCSAVKKKLKLKITHSLNTHSHNALGQWIEGEWPSLVFMWFLTLNSLKNKLWCLSCSLLRRGVQVLACLSDNKTCKNRFKNYRFSIIGIVDIASDMFNLFLFSI